MSEGGRWAKGGTWSEGRKKVVSMEGKAKSRYLGRGSKGMVSEGWWREKRGIIGMVGRKKMVSQFLTQEKGVKGEK